MRRKYKVEITVNVSMIPERAKGTVGTDLASHTQAVEYLGEPGGKVGQYGDADHLGQIMETCEASARISTRAAIAKAHEFLTTHHPDTAPSAQEQAVTDLGAVGKAPEDPGYTGTTDSSQETPEQVPEKDDTEPN